MIVDLNNVINCEFGFRLQILNKEPNSWFGQPEEIAIILFIITIKSTNTILYPEVFTCNNGSQAIFCRMSYLLKVIV